MALDGDDHAMLQTGLGRLREAVRAEGDGGSVCDLLERMCDSAERIADALERVASKLEGRDGGS